MNVYQPTVLSSDALLADRYLQESTMDRRRQAANSHQTVTSYSTGGRLSPLPPVIPPLPSSELVHLGIQHSPNGFHRETSPQIQQIYSSTITISKTMYDTDSDVNNEMNTARSPYNSLSRSSKSPYSSSSLQQQQHNTQFNSQVNSGGNNRHTGIAASPSLVSDNLCELDNLLDDLSESTKQYSLSRDRKTREYNASSPSGFDSMPRTVTSNSSRAGSIQRELEIPKLSEMQKSSPSPVNVMQHRQLRSPQPPQTGQGIPLHLQTPLAGPSVSPVLGDSLVRIYQQTDLVSSSPTMHQQVSYAHPQQSSALVQDYSVGPQQTQHYDRLPNSAGAGQSYNSLSRSTVTTQQHGSLSQSYVGQNYSTMPQSGGISQSYSTMPQSGGISQSSGTMQQSTGVSQNYSNFPHSGGNSQSYNTLPQSAGINHSYSTTPQSGGIDHSYDTISQSFVGQNYSTMPQSGGANQNYGSMGMAQSGGTNQIYGSPRNIGSNQFSQSLMNNQSSVGVIHPQMTSRVSPQHVDELANVGGYAEIQPVVRTANYNDRVDKKHGGQQQSGAKQGQRSNGEELIQPSKNKGQQSAFQAADNDLEDLMASIAAFDTAASSKDPDKSADPVYAQPMKVQSQVDGKIMSNDMGNSSTSGRGSSTADNGGQSTLSKHYHTVPDAVQLGKTISPQAVVSGDQLHGQLSGEFDQNGLPLVNKGNCAACGQSIVGQVLMALGKLWHVSHFTCAHCKTELETSIFYEREGLPYCVNDYQNLFLPKCADCGEVILENCLKAFDKNWHMEHFRCDECNKPIIDDKYYETNGRVLCSNDYLRMYAPMCAGCGKPIMSSYITSLHQNWHSECFVCAECQLPFEKSAFYELNGSMYCERHFYAHRGAICASCSQPIAGRCVNALYKKYHPEHFVCSFCLQPLNKGTFKEQGEKPYCHCCFSKLFG